MDVANETPFPYENLVVDIPDYPEPGVVFKDITPLIADERGFSACVDAMTQHFLGKGVTKVVGSEARGFLIGTPVAYRLGAAFVPARSPESCREKSTRRAMPSSMAPTSCRFTRTRSRLTTA